MHVPAKHEAAEPARRDRPHKIAVCRPLPERDELDLRQSALALILGHSFATYDLSQSGEKEAVYGLDIWQDGEECVAHETARRGRYSGCTDCQVVPHLV